MQQDQSSEQFSFIQIQPENQQTTTNILQQSAIFGEESDQPTIISEQVMGFNPITPKQHLTQQLESFGSILARYLALQLIGIQNSLQQSVEYLQNNVQDMKMTIYNAYVMFSNKNQQQEFELARLEQCNQIQAIIDLIEDQHCKQILFKLLGNIEEVRFANQYKLTIASPELLETQTIYFQVIQKDSTMKTFMDLVKKDSIIIAQQLFPHIVVLSAAFKEILKLDIIHQTQQNAFSQQKFVNHIQQLSKNLEISSYCLQISTIYPQMKEHFLEIEEIRNKQRDQFEYELLEEDKEILQLFCDRQSTHVQQLSQEQQFPDHICDLIQLTCFLITDKSESKENNLKKKIQNQIQTILQKENFKQNSFIFDLIADTIHSSQLKLLFYGYVECTLDLKFVKFYKYLKTDLITLNQLSKRSCNNFNQEQLQQLKDKACITKRQNLQYQDFSQIINKAGELEILIMAEQQEAIVDEINEFENMIYESLEINELIINKEPQALYIRMKKLKFLMELLLRYYKVSSQTLQKLFLYYEQIYENKQQSAIFQKQKVVVSKEQYSSVQNQKRTQNWMEIQNQILNADNLGTEKNYYRPSIYRIFKELINQQANQTCLQKILIKFQQKYQNSYANQIQSDFVNLLKEIKSYQKDKQVEFEKNFRKYYKKEFKNQLIELPNNQFESVAFALKLIQEIDNRQND
ncbi:unnamed protein product [Paramecium sonneborni]|uniref:Uncharacterized protein n=1 Tax=Paramecium sonneborni TaxID=65129 RepID=A0A8S1R9C9_9CILI|nr:unnamed protein product [Paramecium sonneborni]